MINVPWDVFKELNRLEVQVVRVLKNSLAKGPVYSITNAAQGWVEVSSDRFMPEVNKLLSQLKVLSARTLFDKIYPAEMPRWK